MIRRPPRSTQSRSSAASDVYKRQVDQNDCAARAVGAAEVVGQHAGKRAAGVVVKFGCGVAIGAGRGRRSEEAVAHLYLVLFSAEVSGAEPDVLDGVVAVSYTH